MQSQIPTREIGSPYLDFQRLSTQFQPPAKPSFSRAKLFGLLMIAIGLGGWWLNWHLADTEGHFYIKLCILGPLGIFGGLLMLFRPEWAGPLRKDSQPAHKAALATVVGLMLVTSGIDFYRLLHHHSARPLRTRQTLAPAPSRDTWAPKFVSPSMGRPAVHTAVMAASTDLRFLGQTYRLGSFNDRTNPMWEFVAPGERIDDWKTLFTVIDRPDAHGREALDRLAEGLMSNYKSHGARVLLARTMEDAGAVFNYMVVAFDEPGQHRYELNFVKVGLGLQNAVVVIYGVRIADPGDYATKAKEFLDRNSSEIGRALGALVLPETTKLPRRPF